MGRTALLVLPVTVLLWCCTQEKAPNKFSDPVFIRIADFQDRRFSDSLYQFLRSPEPEYRSAASLAFASIQDSSASVILGNLLLEDTSHEVRSCAAYALGQTRGVAAVNALIPAMNDSNLTVVREVLEALGKSIGDEDLETLTHYDARDTLSQEGLAWSFYRLALRNKVDSVMVSRENKFLTGNYTPATRLGAAHFFNQSAVADGAFEKNLIQAALHDPSVEVRIAAVGGLRKLKNENALSALRKVFESEKDYRVRISAVRSLQVFSFDETGELFLKALHDHHPAVAVAASEIAQTIIKTADPKLLEEARSANRVRIQANLYKAIFATGPYSLEMVEEVKRKYLSSKSDYERAAWLGPLSAVTGAYRFIFDEFMHADAFVVRSAAAQALVDINHRPDFPKGKKKEMGNLYSQVIAQGDPAAISIASEALADPVLGYKGVITDFTFLYEARKGLHLPMDIEALQPLTNAIAYFEGKEKPSPLKNSFNHPVDWKLVASIDRNQKVLVKTTRGDILLRLLVEEAPGSVANFVALVNSKYFDGRYYHRVVPNFVIQTGCRRGDGFGSEDYSIRSEFSSHRYKAGSVGMASAGKDTEGTQWFITHSPTPHLDGRYTIFAEVEDGMNIVEQIEVGDQNETVSLIMN